MADNRDAIRPLTFNLGSIERIAPGQGRCFVVCGDEIAVFRQRNGALFATQNRCPHKQGPLSEGIIGADKVVCPLHSHKFDLCSGHGENDECVRVFPVQEVNGEIILSYVAAEVAEVSRR
jgi:nitrite reductase (NADH) small subunit